MIKRGKIMLEKKVRTDSYILIKICNKLFQFFQKMGIHITPNHFYFPIPDTRNLKNELWLKHSDMIGININDEMQINLLSEFCSKFKKEYDKFPINQTEIPYKYFVTNNFFRVVDGEIYYCMIRFFKPKKIIEVGGGYSTYIAAEAILKNKKEDGKESELIVIDPYPNKLLKEGFPGLTKVIETKTENIKISQFQELQENDILFIDTSHVIKIGNDVQYLYSEVLPRINKGVLVHIHDIFLPGHYPKEWVMERTCFWNEQYLLQAFLTYNNKFEIVLSNSYLHRKHQDILENMFRTYNARGISPSSFWIKRRKIS